MEPISNPPVAFVGVGVIPMDRPGVLEHQTVVATGDRITAVGPVDEVRAPADALIVDGDGRFLMPGIADMHTHLWMRDPHPGHLVLYLAEGATTVRSMSGAPENVEWRGQIEQGKLAGPTILSSGKTIIDGLDGFDPDFIASMPVFVPATTEEAKDEVGRQVAEGVDLVKVYDGLTPEQYLAAIATARDAGTYVAGHVLDELPLETILTSGINEIAHLDELNFSHWIGFPGQPDFGLNFDAIPNTAKLMKDNDVAIVSNLSADEVTYQLIFDTDGVLARPEFRVVRPELLETWRTEGRQLTRFAEQGLYRRDMEMPFFQALMRGLRDGGVTITIGTDTGPLVEGTVPSQIHRELELLVEAGFSTYDALSAGTRDAAAIVEKMGRDGGFGVVGPGRRADLMLLAGNPLEDVSQTRNRIGVMAQGIWRTQATLDQMVDDFIATYTQAPTSAG